MSVTDLNRGELRNMILGELKEPATSEAFPTQLLDELINEFYFDVFNQPRKSTYLTEGKDEFVTVADKALNGAINPGDTSIVLNDSSAFPATGRILIDNDFIDYTANVANTLTCSATAIHTPHIDGSTVRSLRALPADIDGNAARYMNLDGLSYDYEDYSKMLNQDTNNYYYYSIFEGYIIFPVDNAAHNAILTYKKATIPIPTVDTVADATSPSLIPNSFRRSLLVNGVVGKALYLDGQDGWQKYWDPDSFGGKGSGLYYLNLKRFYAKFKRRIDGVAKQNRSFYD